MPQTENRWIQFGINPAEHAVLKSAVLKLDGETYEFCDLCNEDGEFVYGGNVFELKRALTSVAKEHRDPTARDVRMRIRDIQRDQKVARGEVV